MRRGWIRRSWAAVTGTGTAASVALALLVMACAFVAVALPRASLGYRTQVLQRIFRSASSSQTSVLADASITSLGNNFLTTAQLISAHSQLLAGLRGDDLPLAPAAQQWTGMSTGSTQFAVTGEPADKTMAPPQLELIYRGELNSNARLVAGTLPSQATLNGASGTSGTVQVAVSQATAARFRLRVGSRIRAASDVLVVTGIVRPLGAASSFWTVDPAAAVPQLTYPGLNSAPYLGVGAFVGPAELTALQSFLDTRPLQGVWSFPLELGHINADQAAGLQRALASVAYLTAASSVSVGFSASAGESSTFQISLISGLGTMLQPFVTTDDAVQRALSLLFVSLAVIAAVVVLLGARLVGEHRRGEFTLMRARGASLRQAAAIALRGGAAVVLPAAAVAVAAAVLATPGPASRLSAWLAGLIVAAALAGPPLLTAWWHRTPRDAASAAAVTTAGIRRRAAAARRWIFDAALVAGAVGGLILLRDQGLPPPGSIDLFTSAAPVLAAIPIALLVMRVYPVALRQLTRLARRRRGVVLVVGFARGSAAVQAAVLPAFALVLAFAVLAFAATARNAVTRADVAASWQATGADAIVTAPAVGPGISPAAQRLIAAVPGVRRYAAVAVTTGTSSQGQSLPVIFVDPRQYAALTAATPVPAFPAAALARPHAVSGGPAAPVPVLISPGARALLKARDQLSVAGHQLQIRAAGTLAGIAGASAGSQFVVLPRWALGRQVPPATVIAIAGPRLDTAALTRTARRAVPGAQTALRSSVLASISSAPLPHGGFVTFAQGIAAAAAFSMLILLLTLVLGTRSRELTLARLTTMGLRPAQSRWVTAVETMPAIAAAAVGGSACALVLVPLVGSAVDLAAFTGVPVDVPLHADAVIIVVAAAGLLLLAGLTLALQGRLARGRGVTRALRVDE
ncbi:MAG TPA: hypothetical protein VGL63_17840 [Streptosporangiaceae bacterium]|jgi:putative ABC transport system permease protein